MSAIPEDVMKAAADHCGKTGWSATNYDGTPSQVCITIAGAIHSYAAALETEVAGLKLYAGEKSNQYVAAMEENKALRKALEPFIRHYEPWMDSWDDDVQASTFPRHTFGELRRARLASTERTEGK
ncbi:MAG: hypothetical protein AAAC47_13010 [Pararhizobium sp.]